MITRHSVCFAALATFALGCASFPAPQGPESVSGTWRSRGTAPYIVEHTLDRPHGRALDHPHVELLERSASFEWELHERPDGLVIGTSRWISYGPDGKELFRGVEPLLGVHDGERLILEEPADDATKTPQLVFDCVFDGPDRIRAMGYEVGSKDLMAVRVVLHRD